MGGQVNYDAGEFAMLAKAASVRGISKAALSDRLRESLGQRVAAIQADVDQVLAEAKDIRRLMAQRQPRP